MMIYSVGISQRVMRADRDGVMGESEVFRTLTVEEVRDYLSNIA